MDGQDSTDRSLTAYCFHQACKALKKDTAYFCVEDHCFQLKGGLSVVLDARVTAHGVWAASGNVADPFVGCAFVEKQ